MLSNKTFLKLLFLITSTIVPVLAIYLSMDTYSALAIETLIERLQDTLHNKVDGVESVYNWKSLFGRIIIFYTLYLLIVKRYIKNYKDSLSAKEKRQSFVLLSLKILKTFIIWFSLYSLATWLNINTQSYWDSTNLILYSVIISEVIRIKLVYEERVK